MRSSCGSCSAAKSSTCCIVTACESVKLPARVRRRDDIQPPQPSALPRSWQSVRTYVPLEQRTRRAYSRRPSPSSSSSSWMVIAAGLPLDLLAPAGQLIELLAADFNGGIHGRDLLDGRRAKRWQRRLAASACVTVTGCVSRTVAARVLRVGHRRRGAGPRCIPFPLIPEIPPPGSRGR